MDNASEHIEPNGETSVLIMPSGANYTMLRLAMRKATSKDHAFAQTWREKTRSLSLNEFFQYFNAYRVIIPTVKTSESGERALSVVDSLLSMGSMQHLWIDWWVKEVADGPHYRSVVLARWRRSGCPPLATFAPYAYHCMRALLLLAVYSKFSLLKVQSSNLIDLQYLYYLPFCMAFISDDKLHHKLAPWLLMPGQVFVKGSDLKASLRQLVTYRDEIDPALRSRRAYALSSYPPPFPNNVVFDLWRRVNGECSPQWQIVP